MNYYVYVLRSEKTNYAYVGQTKDLQKRLREHNAGLTKSIQFQIPFKIEYYEMVGSRTEAMKREKIFKSGKGRQWLKENVLKN